MKQINGDITKVITSGYIMHQVNCQGAMGAGVALALLKRWPQVRSKYITYVKGFADKHQLLGKMQIVKINDDLSVINSFTQFGYGNSYKSNKVDTDEKLLIANIHFMAEQAKEENTTLAVPDHIGCGLAGGNWQTVYDNIKDIDNLIIVKF